MESQAFVEGIKVLFKRFGKLFGYFCDGLRALDNHVFILQLNREFNADLVTRREQHPRFHKYPHTLTTT